MESYLSAEDNARVEIDKMLETAGWAVQTRAT
jgi:type I site-specific restriction endonuclease